jgi:hypothetical protein
MRIILPRTLVLIVQFPAPIEPSYWQITALGAPCGPPMWMKSKIYVGWWL